VRDNSSVVDWLRPRHPVPGGLRFRAVPCWVRTVFAVKQTVKSARLLRPSSAPTTSSIALGGIILAARGLTSGVLVGDVMHLLLTAVVPTGV
jgi:flagellar biosynthesis protein FliR